MFLFTENASFALRINTTVIEPENTSFLPMEQQLEDADLSHVNTILQKHGLYLLIIRKGSLFFHFSVNRQIDEENFMYAFARIVLDLFQNNVYSLGQIKLLGMALEFAPSGVKIQRKNLIY